MTDNKALPGLQRFVSKLPKALLVVLGILLLLIVLLIIASFFIDEPLRRYTEREANRQLKGYTVRIPHLSLHPLSLSVTLKNLSITQEKHPDPPVARFDRIHSGIYWRGLLSGRLVAEMKVAHPVINVNLAQLKEEAKHPEPVRKKRWQQAVQALYPLKVNVFSISDGDITYVDEKAIKKPLHFTKLNLRVRNIRNRASAKNVFPSPFHMDMVIFGTGKVAVDGAANFLAEPNPTGQATFEVTNVPLDYLKPILARSKVDIEGGILSTSGRVVYAPKEKIAEVKYLTVEKLKADYIQEGVTAVTKKKGKAEAVQEAKKIQEKPGLLLRLDRLQIKDCEFGFINRQASPTYRAFMSNTDLLLTNLSNKFSQGPAKLNLSGKFMGSGATKVTATFRPEEKGPDFDLNLSIYGTDMKTMNNLLRAYGNFDVVAGKFSFYSEITVNGTRVKGYVKPLFRDMNVYDRRQDKEKGLFRKLYEGLVGGVAGLLENRPRESVATKTDISGTLDQPRVGTWQTIVNLLRNAFLRAILPGFEEEVRRGGGK